MKSLTIGADGRSNTTLNRRALTSFGKFQRLERFELFSNHGDVYNEDEIWCGATTAQDDDDNNEEDEDDDEDAVQLFLTGDENSDENENECSEIFFPSTMTSFNLRGCFADPKRGGSLSADGKKGNAQALVDQRRAQLRCFEDVGGFSFVDVVAGSLAFTIVRSSRSVVVGARRGRAVRQNRAGLFQIVSQHQQPQSRFDFEQVQKFKKSIGGAMRQSLRTRYSEF
ncbi:unnamed protein product [Rotaria socialis]|nr:unnamed protein product [Rotaria socialis]